MYTLENEILHVKLNPAGAELSSVIKKSTQQEYMWQGDPEIWGSQAPVLFPIVGGLKDDTYFYENKAYQLPKHGFIRYNKDLVFKKDSDTKISLSLGSSEKTLAMYPFEFFFEISFELIENKIEISHRIENIGTKTMYFNVGGHPAFNCPLEDTELYNEYYITLKDEAEHESYALAPNGLIQEGTFPVFNDKKLPLTQNLFDNDALIFKNIKAKEATLYHKTKGAIVGLTFEDFPDLGIWAKPKAPFVCIEPWLGYADVEHSNQILEDKEGIKRLNPGELHRSSYAITIY
ncbi:aldose 1-epimerase family protein [Aquimarina sp. D1M17]|uniref:aldose 1-epimerase family protein n=1 Tax=Aquimarina acroporae TaxID=2937283 RepID=UPI0020BDE7A8|nr:aldose 1-epimerase family protein [Aquimarina acroporae]MCK8520162.1 aldose 1-epimerase family protein [Aquimarina acroporae]